MSFVVINEEVYDTNTPEEIEVARIALRNAALDKTAEFCGEPDGLGDSYRTGFLFARQDGRISK